MLFDAERAIRFAPVEADWFVLPVGQDVDGDEIDFVGERGVAQPEFPYVGIGHRLAHALLDLANIAAQLRGRHVLAQQDLIADDHPLNRVGIEVGMVDQKIDLFEIFLLVEAEPGASPNFQAILSGTLRHDLEILA